MVARAIEPVQLGLVGALQLGRLDKHRTVRDQTTQTQLWLVTSRSADALPAAAFLHARRQEWGIENGLHHVLDVSGDEDRRLKVRTPNSLCVLTLLGRLSVMLWRRSRKEAQSYYRWREHQKARCHGLLQVLRAPPGQVKW